MGRASASPQRQEWRKSDRRPSGGGCIVFVRGQPACSPILPCARSFHSTGPSLPSVLPGLLSLITHSKSLAILGKGDITRQNQNDANMTRRSSFVFGRIVIDHQESFSVSTTRLEPKSRRTAARTPAHAPGQLASLALFDFVFENKERESVVRPTKRCISRILHQVKRPRIL
jgi:hypothetical protein